MLVARPHSDAGGEDPGLPRPKGAASGNAEGEVVARGSASVCGQHRRRYPQRTTAPGMQMEGWWREVAAPAELRQRVSVLGGGCAEASLRTSGTMGPAFVAGTHRFTPGMIIGMWCCTTHYSLRDLQGDGSRGQAPG